MRLKVVVCDLLVLAAPRRILTPSRGLPVSEMMSQLAIPDSSDSRNSLTSKNDSNPLLAKARNDLESRRSALIASESTKTDGLTSGRNASDKLQVHTSSPDSSSNQDKFEKLWTPPLAPIDKIDSSTMFAKPQKAPESQRSATGADIWARADSPTSSDESDKIKTQNPLLHNLFSNQRKLEPLETPALASQLTQLNFSTNMSSKHSGYSLFSNMTSAALKVHVWDGTLNFKGTMLLLLFFGLGCGANACLRGALEGSDNEHHTQDDSKHRSVFPFRHKRSSAATADHTDPAGEDEFGEEIVDHKPSLIKSVVNKGKVTRGADTDEHYKFGDFTRGLFSKKRPGH
jgi:hypothetical protein